MTSHFITFSSQDHLHFMTCRLWESKSFVTSPFSLGELANLHIHCDFSSLYKNLKTLNVSTTWAERSDHGGVRERWSGRTGSDGGRKVAVRRKKKSPSCVFHRIRKFHEKSIVKIFGWFENESVFTWKRFQIQCMHFSLQCRRRQLCRWRFMMGFHRIISRYYSSTAGDLVNVVCEPRSSSITCPWFTLWCYR